MAAFMLGCNCANHKNVTMAKKTHKPNLEEPDKIVRIDFKLFTGFDESSSPTFKKGTIEDTGELTDFALEIVNLKPNKTLYTAISMGEVEAVFSDGRHVLIRPVFHESANKYKDLFYIGNDQYFMSPGMERMLNDWRQHN